MSGDSHGDSVGKRGGLKDFVCGVPLNNKTLNMTFQASKHIAIEAIEATRLPAITPGPCTRAPAV